MIDEKKNASALRALNAVLYLARSMAYDGESGQTLADVLDDAEYLPLLMLSPKDETASFRGMLVSLASRYPLFQSAVDKFDSESP